MFIKEKKSMKKWNNAEIVALDLNKTENGCWNLVSEGVHCFFGIPIYIPVGPNPCPPAPTPDPTPEEPGDQPTSEAGTPAELLS